MTDAEGKADILESFDLMKEGVGELFDVCEKATAENERLRALVLRAVESWGDYIPMSNSNAGRVLQEMKEFVWEGTEEGGCEFS